MDNSDKLLIGYDFVDHQDGVIRFLFKFAEVKPIREEIISIMGKDGYQYMDHYTINTGNRVNLNNKSYNPTFCMAVDVYFCDPEDFVMMKLRHG